MHAGFVVGATGSVIVKLAPALIPLTYGGSSEAMFAGAGVQPVPVATYVKANRLFAVTAVVFTVNVVAAAATCTSPAGALPQAAGDAVELQLKNVPIVLPVKFPYTPVGVTICSEVVLTGGGPPQTVVFWSVIVVVETGTNAPPLAQELVGTYTALIEAGPLVRNAPQYAVPAGSAGSEMTAHWLVPFRLTPLLAGPSLVAPPVPVNGLELASHATTP